MTQAAIRPRRSFIFAPGLRPEMFPKALASGADIVCVELEDGIAPKDKAAARASAMALFAQPQAEDGVERIVRINCLREAFGIADVQAVLETETPPPALMLPKVRAPDEIALLDDLLTERGHPTRLHVIIETNRGLEAAFEIAHCSDRIDALFFGGVDMAAELRCQNAWEPLLYARARVVHAAASAGLDVIDVPFLDLDDPEAMVQQARKARDLGFSGKGAIHPKQIAALNQLQEQQYIDGEKGDVDILAAAVAPDCVSVQMLYVRTGRVLGSRGYFPRLPLAENPGEALAAFIPGFYLRPAAEIPRKILLSHPVAGAGVLEEALGRRSGRKVRLQSRVQGARLRWLRLARETAEQNLQGRMAGERQTVAQLQELRQALQLEETPRRLECFDVSHSGGIETVASCVAFDQEGARKNDYRRYIIRGIAPGDDYAALRQALLRRYRRVQTGQGGAVPDVLLVDGGAGQLRKAREVWDELGLGETALLGVAKGRGRRPGRERLWTGSGKELRLAPDSGALHLVQRIRDEAHRFAIEGHRRRRSARSRTSPLAEVPGIGPKRRRALLRSFGGLQGIRKAAPEEIARTPGISLKMAEDILAHLRRN